MEADRAGFPRRRLQRDTRQLRLSFDGYAAFLDDFVKTLGLDRFALYLHDFGSPIGARLAIKATERIVALIIQNGDNETHLDEVVAVIRDFLSRLHAKPA